MRDEHRMKEKYDLSLDNRQIVSLLISSLVVLGAVFVLGVVVGKKLSTNTKAAQAPDLLTALDQKASQMEQVHKEPALTFQDALTAKTPDQVVAATAKAPEPPAPKVEPAKTVVKPEAQAKVEPARLVEKPAVPATQKPAPKADAKGAFALQVAASQDRHEAERQVARLKEKGYSPYIVTGDVPGKGTWFRVRVGHFRTRDEATRYRQDFTRETRQDAFVAAD
jgi:DedD protein